MEIGPSFVSFIGRFLRVAPNADQLGDAIFPVFPATGAKILDAWQWNRHIVARKAQDPRRLVVRGIVHKRAFFQPQ